MHLEEYVIRLEKNSVGPFQKCTEKREESKFRVYLNSTIQNFLLLTEVLVPGVGFSVAGLDRIKFGFKFDYRVFFLLSS